MWCSALALSLLLAGASADTGTCTADGLEGRIAAAQAFAATSGGKCNSKDACYAMMQMDQLYVDGKFDNGLGAGAASLGDLGYYSPYKVKQSMIMGGEAADSAACSFGTMADLSRKGLITSNCAADIADATNPNRGAIINMFTNYWCPYVLTNADLLCSVDHMGRETKFAVMDCESVPFHIEHPTLLASNMTTPGLQTASLNVFANTNNFLMAAALSAIAGATMTMLVMKARRQTSIDNEPLLAA